MSPIQAAKKRKAEVHKRKTQDTYSVALREGARRALADNGIDPDVYSQTAKLSRDLGFGSRFLHQWIVEQKVVTPNAGSLRILLQWLGKTEEQLISSQRTGHANAGPEAVINRDKAQVGEMDVEDLTSRVREYDIRAIQPKSAAQMSDIEERPVVAERPIPQNLINRMHPNARPAIIRITGDSMSPTYQDGACLLVDAAVRHPSPPGVFVIWDGTYHIVQRCQVVLGSNPLSVKVISDNQSYEAQTVAIETLQVCGAVFCELDPVTWAEKSVAAE